MDCFAGTGTFGETAKKMDRVGLLCEQHPDYVEHIAKKGYKIISPRNHFEAQVVIYVLKKSTVATKQKTRNLRVFLGANNLLFIEITNTHANTTAIIGGKRAIDFE